jgi:FixJ family two-component response regulator
MPDNALIIDDDPALRDSSGRLLRSIDLDAQLFASISDFLKSDPPDGPTCLVLDVRLPGKAVSIFSATLPRRIENSNYLYHRARRHSDIGAGDERWCH